MRPMSTLEIVPSVIVWSRCGENGHCERRMMRVQSSNQETMVLEYALHKISDGTCSLAFCRNMNCS